MGNEQQHSRQRVLNLVRGQISKIIKWCNFGDASIFFLPIIPIKKLVNAFKIDALALDSNSRQRVLRLMYAQISKIIKRYNFGDASIFFAPNIPHQKLANALKTYAPGITPKEVILLLDETISGNAKEGMLLTEEEVFGHEIFTSPVSFRLREIRNIEAQGKDIYINNKRWFSCNLLEEDFVSAFCSLIMAIVRIFAEEEQLLKTVKQGDVFTQYSLGEMYHSMAQLDDMFCENRNYKQAVKLYLMAAEQGHAEAQYELALMYQGGRVVGRNYKKSENWLRKAAEQGHADAQYELAELYRYGWCGIKKDEEEAAKWYRKAAEQGHADARHGLHKP